MSEPYFIAAGGISDNGFDAELVSDQFPDWTFSGSGSFTRETLNQYDGDSFAIISAETQGNNYFYQDLDASDLEEGRTYFLSFRYQILDDDLTVGTDGGAKVQLAIRGGQNDGIVFAATKPVYEQTGENWTQIRVGFTARAENTRISVGMWNASGKLAFDDVRINVMEDQDGAEVINPDFEPFNDLGQTPFGWTASLSGGTIATVNDDNYSGVSCVKLHRDSRGNTTLTQTISFPSGQITPYVGEIYVKVEDVELDGALLRISQTVTGGTEDIFISNSLNGSGDWIRIPFKFKTQVDGSHTNELTISLELNDAGTVRFDGLVLKRVSLMATDFDDPNWENYWTKTGVGNYVIKTEDGKKKVRITNSTVGRTTVTQSFHLIDGLNYSIYGKIKADIEIPDGEDGGFYLEVYDNSEDLTIERIGPFIKQGEWYYWNVTIPWKATSSPLANRYSISAILDNCSGFAESGSFGITGNDLNDRATVIPPPMTVNYYHSHINMEVDQQKWTIVYEGTDADDIRCADDLIFDLSAGRAPSNPDLHHYFKKNRDYLVKREISAFNQSHDIPAIILGIIDATIPQLILNLMNERGIDPDYVRSLAPEGYVLDIPLGPNPIVLILSSTKAGRYYGTQTFLQLISSMVASTSENPYYPIPCLRINDKQEMPIRAVHMQYPINYKAGKNKSHYTETEKMQYDALLLLPRGFGDNRSALEVYVRTLSRMKINMVVIQTPIYYCINAESGYGDHYPQLKYNRDLIKSVFDMCRLYYIEPVPEMQSLGHAGELLQFNPLEVEYCIVGYDSNNNISGGIDPENPTYPFLDPVNDIDSPMPRPPEAFMLDNGERTHLFGRVPNSIKRRKFVLYDPNKPNGIHRIIVEHRRTDGNWELVNDWDYDINYNRIDFDFVNGYQTAAINVTPGGITAEKGENCSITFGPKYKDGDVFRIHYHHINRPLNRPTDKFDWENQHFSYCPSSMDSKKFLEGAISNVMSILTPKYIHLGHDEPNQMHTCAACFPVVTDGDFSPNGTLFGRDVNYLRDYYMKLCEGYGISGKVIIFSDHVCKTHEELKVKWFEDHGGDVDRWWDFRGRRFVIQGGVRNYTEVGYVNSCCLIINKNVIMNDWNYGLETESDPKEWNKAKYIDELTTLGFNVIGGSAGNPYEDPNNGAPGDMENIYCGAMVRAIFYNEPESEETRYVLIGYLQLEGTMEEELPLLNIPNSFNCEADAHEPPLFWFSWLNADGYPAQIGGKPNTYSKVRFECDITGTNAEGKAWFDDVKLEKRDPVSGLWSYILGPDQNGSFENWTVSSFDQWNNPPSPTTVNPDNTIYHKVPLSGDDQSCRMFHNGGTRPWLNALNHQVITLSPALNKGTDVRIKLYARTRKVDTFRLGCPWQWAKCGYGSRFSNSGKGAYLGSINLNWNPEGECLPRDEYFKLRYKTRAGDIAVANWCWKHDYPNDFKLKNVWFEPFLILIKEVPWIAR